MKRIALFASLALVLIITGCSSMRGKGDGGLDEKDLDAQRERRFGEGSIPSAEGEGLFRDVMFDYDSSQVSSTGMQDIEYNIEVIKANPDVKIVLEGHCDERGTNEYNMALGAARAKAVQRALVSLGIPSSRLNTISYGEEIPLDLGHDEMAWSKNRRVHFSPFRDQTGQG